MKGWRERGKEGGGGGKEGERKRGGRIESDRCASTHVGSLKRRRGWWRSKEEEDNDDDNDEDDEEDEEDYRPASLCRPEQTDTRSTHSSCPQAECTWWGEYRIGVEPTLPG